MPRRLTVFVSARSDLVTGPSKFNWGDFWVKEFLLAAFAQHGCPIKGIAPAMMNVYCWGRSPAKRIAKKGVNVAWFYSRPEQMTDSELESFHIVFCTSASYVEEARRPNLIHMPVCSHLFGTAAPVKVACPDVVFIGNARKGHGGRPIAEFLMSRTALPFSLGVWGIGHNPRNPYWRGRYHPFDRLQDLYLSSKVVVIDHYPEMAAGGFLKHQIMDVIAAGGIPLVDRVALPADPPWPTYDGTEDLLCQLREMTSDDPVKLRVWQKRIAASVEHATFVDRAGTMIEEYRKRWA